MSDTPTDHPAVSKPADVAMPVVTAILDAVRAVQYGQVTITIHNGEVVQIDRTERRRLKAKDN